MPKKDAGPPTYADIWNTLSAVDVSDHVEKKGQLTYLSWAWAWSTLMDRYPDAVVLWLDDTEGAPSGYRVHTDGTVTTYCRVQIGDCFREMWLPVMDHRNNAITNPDARKISDTKMRCLVKCLAMFGLGHYIYAGEDLPEAPKESPEEKRGREELEAARKYLKEAVANTKKEGIEVSEELKKKTNAAYNGTDPEKILEIYDMYLSLKDDEDS